MSEELLPCPFCGELPYLRQWSVGARVECHSRNCFGPMTSLYGNGDEAVAAWNRRARRPAEGEGAVAWITPDMSASLAAARRSSKEWQHVVSPVKTEKFTVPLYAPALTGEPRMGAEPEGQDWREGPVVAWKWRAKVKGEWEPWSFVEVDPHDWLWPDNWEDIEVVPLTAASPAIPEMGVGAVAVKPLAWQEITQERSREEPIREPTGDWEANSIAGPYYIQAWEGRWEVSRDHEFVANCDGPEEAKAAAQADYETRIRSALETAETSP